MSLEQYEQYLEQLTPLNEKYKKYNDNKIALRLNQLNVLIEERRKLIEAAKKACPHDKVVIQKGYYTDIGYGCDRHYEHYDLFCNRCETKLTNRTDYGTEYTVSKEMLLIDAVKFTEEKYRDFFSETDLNAMGIQKQTITQTKTTITYR